MINSKYVLQIIPGVGPNIAQDFWNIGIKKVSDLKGKNPGKLYLQICAKQGCQVDRCVLYVCRSSVYFAEHKNPNPEKLKWWNWKDKMVQSNKSKSKKMQKFCHACGMPLTKREDFAGDDKNSNFCRFCVNVDGSVKSCEEIFEGGIQYFMSYVGNDRKMAEKITRKNMNRQPYWQGKNCLILQGDTATDEEFTEVMKKLRPIH